MERLKVRKARRLVVSLFLLHAIVDSSFGQYLEGTYSQITDNGFNREKWTFFKDGTFLLDLRQGIRGEGTYRLTIDSLYLEFQENNSHQLSHLSINKEKQTRGTNVRIRVLDGLDSTLLNYMPVVHLKNAKGDNEVTLYTDENAETSISFEKGSNVSFISLSLVSYETVDLPLTDFQRTRSTITVYLARAASKYDHVTQVSYGIEKKDNQIILNSKNKGIQLVEAN